MRMSVVTDEVSSDLETALELMKEWGAEGVELRGIGESRFPQVSSTWRLRVPELLREAGMPLAAISPGLFKLATPVTQSAGSKILRWEDATVSERIAMTERLATSHLEELLPATIAAASELGCRLIVCFSFENPNWANDSNQRAPEIVIDILRDAAKKVRDAGMNLAVEVEHVCWGSTATSTLGIVERVDDPALGINWDPANAFVAGEDLPFPVGWAMVREHVRHVHYKQARRTPDGRRFDGTGEIDWVGQIAALSANGYDGWISVESHARPKLASARQGLRELLALRQAGKEAQ